MISSFCSTVRSFRDCSSCLAVPGVREPPREVEQWPKLRHRVRARLDDAAGWPCPQASDEPDDVRAIGEPAVLHPARRQVRGIHASERFTPAEQADRLDALRQRRRFGRGADLSEVAHTGVSRREVLEVIRVEDGE